MSKQFNPNEEHSLKEWADYTIGVLKAYFEELYGHYDFSEDQEKLIQFEREYMSDEKYQGGQSIDHVLFRKFLHIFNPGSIEERIEQLFTRLKEFMTSMFATKKDLKDAIDSIDTSDLAKQGYNPNATNSAILDAVQQGGGGLTPEQYDNLAKESTLNAGVDSLRQIILDSFIGVAEERTSQLIRADIAAIKVGMRIVNYQQALTNVILESGTTSMWNGPISSLNIIEFVAPTDGTEAHYRLRFTVSGSSFQLQSPTIDWGGDEPTWTDGKNYEIDIVSDGVKYYAVAKEW